MSLGRHASVDGLLAEIDADALQVQAAALAGQMNDALVDPACPWWYQQAGPPSFGMHAHSDLVEWCRKARDILEQVARA